MNAMAVYAVNNSWSYQERSSSHEGSWQWLSQEGEDHGKLSRAV
jgi:hypothetical protein